MFVVSTLADRATELIDRLGYVGLTLLMTAENLFPPIPSEVVLPLAGAQVQRGLLSFTGALVAATLGSLIGALALYGVGRLGGRSLVLRYGRVLRITPASLDRAEAWFGRYGASVVLCGRLVPGARSLVSVPAGMARMPLGRFCALTTLGSVAWNALLIAAGQALGANWDRVGTVIGPLSGAVLAALALAGAFLVVRAWRRSSRPITG